MRHPSPSTAPGCLPALRNVAIVGIGSYVPEKVLTNKDLEGMVDTTEEWIVTRTGMKERHIARADEMTSDMGAVAARRALDHAGLKATDVDLIVTATISPDVPWPNTGCFIQHQIGATRAFCMGLEAACSGFVYGLDVGRQYVATGAAQTVLVVGAEKMSAFLDWQDRNTCVLFGDGAGAAVLQARPERRGILASAMGTDGALTGLLGIPAGGCRLPATAETVRDRLHFVRMKGRETFKHAVTQMASAAQTVLDRAQIGIDQVHWIVPHQANMRIIQAVGERLGAPMDKVVVNIEKYGNTSSATIGLALDEAVRDGRIQKGQLVLLIAFGGGFTWGAMLLEW